MAEVAKQPSRDAQDDNSAGKLNESRYEQKGTTDHCHFDGYNVAARRLLSKNSIIVVNQAEKL